MIHPTVEEDKLNDVLVMAVVNLFNDLGIKVPRREDGEVVVEHEFITNMQLFDVVLALTDYCFLVRDELNELKESLEK